MKKRDTIKSLLDSNHDIVVVNKYLALLLHLDGAMSNILQELNQYLGCRGLVRQEVKSNINKIKEKLKSNPKNDWNTISSESIDDFSNDYEIFEDMCKRFIGLSPKKSICVTPDHCVGDKVWFFDNNKNPRLAHILDIQIRMSINNEYALQDDSYYNLQLCDKNGKLTKYTIKRGESEIWKHKKDMSNEKD